MTRSFEKRLEALEAPHRRNTGACLECEMAELNGRHLTTCTHGPGMPLSKHLEALKRNNEGEANGND